jgi:cell division protease FtsH
LGYTLNTPTDDKDSVYKSELKNKISMILGGRAAEEIINGDVSGGASNDIERATKIAKTMITRLGMSETLGPRSFGSDQGEVFLGRDFSSSQDYSEEIAAKIDAEIHRIITEAYEIAKDVLRKDIAKLHFITEYLINNEVMDGDQFKATMETDEPTLEEIAAIANAKKQKSIDDNKAAEEERRARLEAEAERLEQEELRAEAEAKAAEEKSEEEATTASADEKEDASNSEENNSENK